MSYPYPIDDDSVYLNDRDIKESEVSNLKDNGYLEDAGDGMLRDSNGDWYHRDGTKFSW